MQIFRGLASLAVATWNAFSALPGPLLPSLFDHNIRPILWLQLCVMIALASSLQVAAATSAGSTIRVGFYDNPPKVFADNEGEPAGFWPELTQLIAAQHEWELEWHFAEWDTLLAALEAGDIDVLVDVAITTDRQESLLFGGETALVSWSQVYAQSSHDIRRIPDLADLQIGILDSSVNVAGPEGLEMLLREYDITAELIPYASYQAIFTDLAIGELDAGVTNRDFGNRFDAEFGLAGTPILFQPVELRYAFAPDSQQAIALREAFDESLRTLQADPGSDYYQQVAYWIAAGAPERRTMVPAWVGWTLGGLFMLALLLSGIILLIETRVRSRTRALRAHEKQLEESRNELQQLLDTRRALINSLPAHVAILDHNGFITAANKRWLDFVQQCSDEDQLPLVGTSYMRSCRRRDQHSPLAVAGLAAGIEDVLAGRREHFEHDYPLSLAGRQHWYRAMVNRIRPEERESRGVVVMHLDITEQKKAETHLNKLAYEDPLTGLSSRNGFVQAVTRLHSQAGWAPRGLVIAMDVLGLRDINDAFGYSAGDELLQELAQRLEAFAGQRGVCSRTGGDEFILYLPERVKDAKATIEQLNEQLCSPYAVAGIEVTMLVRQGYTRLGQQQRSVEILMREAELALSENRQDLRQPWTAYSQKLYQEDRQRIEFTQELRRALDEQQFELYFQPQVNLQNGQPCGIEALVRWNHPQRGLQAPGVFIPLAEKSRLIVPLGDWVLRTACAKLQSWQRAGRQPLPLSVNVSVIQFISGDLPDKVAQLIREFNIDPNCLTLEVTESVFEHESEQLREQLRSLKQLGVRLALDDFGTGYSSLSYLQKYPFDIIKIDRAFVSAMTEDMYSHNIVETIVALAASFGEKVVAEGIETRAVERLLVGLGCEYGQGYLYSKPVTEAGIHSWLDSQQRA